MKKFMILTCVLVTMISLLSIVRIMLGQPGPPIVALGTIVVSIIGLTFGLMTASSFLADHPACRPETERDEHA